MMHACSFGAVKGGTTATSSMCGVQEGILHLVIQVWRDF